MKIFLAVALSVAILLSTTSISSAGNSKFDEPPSAMGIFLDVGALRPVGIATMALGFGIFVAALPFTVITKSVGTSKDALLVKPARYTFVRPVGVFEDY